MLHRNRKPSLRLLGTALAATLLASCASGAPALRLSERGGPGTTPDSSVGAATSAAAPLVVTPMAAVTLPTTQPLAAFSVDRTGTAVVTRDTAGRGTVRWVDNSSQAVTKVRSAPAGWYLDAASAGDGLIAWTEREGLPPVLLTLGVCGDQAASEIA